MPKKPPLSSRLNLSPPVGGLCAGVFIGIFITWSLTISAVNGGHQSMMKLLGIKRQPSQADQMPAAPDMSMSQMTDNLKTKTGDDLDQAFLHEMILHHQGAVDMANLIKSKGLHNELKEMAGSIITAQTTEIDQMKTWQQQWGYKPDQTHEHHGMKH